MSTLPDATPAPAVTPAIKAPKKSRPRARKVPIGRPKGKTAKDFKVKVINDGFIQRSAKPAIKGMALKSRMVRVDAEFAEYMRQEAMKAGTSITEVSRSIYQSIT